MNQVDKLFLTKQALLFQLAEALEKLMIETFSFIASYKTKTVIAQTYRLHPELKRSQHDFAGDDRP